jgi:predicted MFS family arabinose efflux permease
MGQTAVGSGRATPAQAGLFYGWVMVAVTFLAQFVVMGTVFYSYGILLEPLARDLGASRFLIGLGLPALGIVGAIVGPILGREVDRRSIRSLMVLGAVLLAAGFLTLSRATSVWELYLSFGVLISLGMALLGGIANTALVARWFVRRRGTALGISQIGVSLSGFVMAWVTTWLVVQYGWRIATTVFAIVPVLLVAPLVWLLVVDRPEDRGLLPDDDAAAADGEEPPAGASAAPWSIGDALREPGLWIIALVIGLTFASNSAVIQVVYSYVTDLGHTATRAALVLSLMAGMAALGKPLFGWLADRTSPRGAMWLTLGLQAAGVGLLLASSGGGELVFAGVVFGLGYGGVLPLMGVLIGTVFDRDVFGRALGLMGPIMLPFQLIGLPYATWVFGRTGSYRTAFATFVGFYLVAAVILAFLRTPSRGAQAPQPADAPAAADTPVLRETG